MSGHYENDGTRGRINRRTFLKSAALATLPIGCSTFAAPKTNPMLRVRPGDPTWPTASAWEKLNQQVGGRLIKLESPLADCAQSDTAACAEARRALKDPFLISNQPALTQNFGWVNAWQTSPSVYAVAATKTEDVAAAINFARTHNLRLVVKGGGHSYQGTSCAPDSLLIWTRRMNQVTLHDSFVAQSSTEPPQPAVSLGAGAIWMEAYDAVVTKAGRYVQGGGCTTVGVAGLVQSGGFGSFSKNFGMAAAALLEAEVVTADGKTLIANANLNPDLFWALKGGGGGSIAVITRLTLRTRGLPAFFGGVFGSIKARSDSAFRKLISESMRFYRTQLFNPHWGEQISFQRDNTLRISMVFQGLTREEASEIWRPFVDWISKAPGDFKIERDLAILALPARDFWNFEKLRQTIPDAVRLDKRPDAMPGHFFWAGDGEQAGQFLYAYQSTWMPASLLQNENQPKLVDAIFAATRHSGVSFHFNKGLAGARQSEIEAARNTATNPAVLDAFALAIIAQTGTVANPGAAGTRRAREVANAMKPLRAIAPDPGSYVSESDFFEQSWQKSFWGANYPRLAAIKKKYDPDDLFFVHHGVGSEEWSADGFTRRS